MNKIEALFSKLIMISQNPAKSIAEYKEKTGLDAVGIMPAYSPEEIIHAAGFLPVGIWGGDIGVLPKPVLFYRHLPVPLCSR
jgi:benzoyl-CoA reductase/2-hydroxyglutaryl-CoA dehydratase subunit BcrC/BadD/HgdB